MKSNKIELGIIGLFLVFLIFKRLQVPGGPILVTISSASLATFYLIKAFGSFKTMSQEKTASFGNFFFYLLTAFCLFSLLFQVMFWPGGPLLSYRILQLTCIIIPILYIASLSKGSKNLPLLWNSVRQSILRLLAYLSIVLLLTLLPTPIKIKLFSSNPERDLQKIESFSGPVNSNPH